VIETHESEALVRERYGWAEVDPAGPVVAGETGTWKITYHAGRYGIDDGGVIKFAWRDVSDWAYPQFDDPSAPAFASVVTDGPASVRPWFDKQRYVRPWRLCVTVDIFDDSLREGDTITLTIGDRSGGSEGSRAQTFCKEAFEFRVSVDWCGTWVYTEVPSPVFPIVNGPPAKLVVVGPSMTTPNTPAWAGVKLEDLWGNPCRDYTGEVRIGAEGVVGLPDSYRFTDQDLGAHRFEGLSVSETGTYAVKAEDVASGLSAEGNPLVCVSAMPEDRPFWGDLHGQSEETVGTNPVSSYFTFARDSALVDFAGHQGNDFQITEAVWDEIKHQANTHNDPGRFVAYVGWEWSGNTPVGGDHNVYYPGDDGPLYRSSHVLIPDKSDLNTDCLHVTDLYQALKGKDVLLVPHVGGRYANLEWHDPELEAVVEVYSEWGEFEWFLKEAIEKGYRVGFTAGSDDHKGRPGAAYSGSGSFGVYGGLTCIQAKELTRESLWEAIKARRCYGTTGQRILIEATADGHPMGSAYTKDSGPVIDVHVIGTAPIERIDIVRGIEDIYSFPEEPKRSSNRVRVAWSGQRIRARNRLVRWDGGLTIDKGQLSDVSGYAFDTPAEGITAVSDQSIDWRSVTTGDADGVLFDFDCSDDAKIDFNTPVLNRTVTVGTLKLGPVTVEAGGVDMKVVFEMEPVGIGREARVTFKDENAPKGIHPYWIRVTQMDGAKAWVSPFYVEIS
jgi:hypothetical protein